MSTERDEHLLVQGLGLIQRAKLADHRDRRHWRECSPQFLLDRLHEEIWELEEAVLGCLEDGSTEPGDVWREAADVANFAAMVADNVEGRP